MAAEYQVLARKYRPQSFKDVLGQDHIVQTLKNAIKNSRLAHAYLFCGSRGTGKTTLARVFAKALNCENPSVDLEPCNICSSCKEITNGNSLDVLEIDGASHRGIDDIRQINETVGYTAASGKYKIYIIDEVHMLTKEAFNALLKTLEEPPPKVKFFFATTEPHKVLPTILSRCQRFNLNRIPIENIIGKLTYICEKQNVTIEAEAIRLLAQRAEGGLRDAESLLDQIIAFQEGAITASSIAEILGIMPRQVFFDIDRAAKEGNIATAFEVANIVFSQGKDLTHFIEGLTEHFRTLAIVKISGKDASYINLLEDERNQYEVAAKLYTQEQILSLLELLTETQQQIRFMPAPRMALEAVLLKILRIHQRLPIEFIVRRLAELETAIGKAPVSSTPQNETDKPGIDKTTTPLVIPLKQSFSSITEDPTPTLEELGKKKAPAPLKTEPSPKPPVQADAAPKPQTLIQPEATQPSFLTPAAPVQQAPTAQPKPQAATGQQAAPASSPAETPKAAAPLLSNEEARKKQSQYDTLLQFTAVELEGTVQKKPQFGQNKG